MNEHCQAQGATPGRLAVVALLVAGMTAAVPVGGQDLPRHVIAGGGGQSAGGDHVLTGTAGQSAAQVSAAGVYVVSGGFWTQTQPPDLVFRDGFESFSTRETES